MSKKTRSDQLDLFAWSDVQAPSTRNVVPFSRVGYGRLSVLLDHRTITPQEVDAVIDALGRDAIGHKLLIIDNAVSGERVRTDPESVAETQQRWRGAQLLRKRGLRVPVKRPAGVPYRQDRS